MSVKRQVSVAQMLNIKRSGKELDSIHKERAPDNRMMQTIYMYENDLFAASW
jgi:hypothetical protein